MDFPFLAMLGLQVPMATAGVGWQLSPFTGQLSPFIGQLDLFTYGLALAGMRAPADVSIWVSPKTSLKQGLGCR